MGDATARTVGRGGLHHLMLALQTGLAAAWATHIGTIHPFADTDDPADHPQHNRPDQHQRPAVRQPDPAPLGKGQGDHVLDSRHARKNTLGHPPVAKTRQHRVVDHRLSARVVGPGKPRPKLDPHRPVVTGDQQQHAVILGRITDPQVIEQRGGIGLKALARAAMIGKTVHGDHHQRNPCLGADVLNVRPQLGFLGRGQQVCKVGNPVSIGPGQTIGQGGKGEQKDRKEQLQAHQTTPRFRAASWKGPDSLPLVNAAHAPPGARQKEDESKTQGRQRKSPESRP